MDDVAQVVQGARRSGVSYLGRQLSSGLAISSLEILRPHVLETLRHSYEDQVLMPTF